MSRCCFCDRRIYGPGEAYYTTGLFHFTDKVLGTSAFDLIRGDSCKDCAKIISRFYWTIEQVRSRLKERG